MTTIPNDNTTLISGITFTGDFTLAKLGSIALLPEPFYFNQSIVSFNNRVYECVISNNDDEFIFGKWELLDPGDRRLNAMDRVIGYYQPTVDMPGIDLTQLFEGVTYPNSTYLGNAFQPDQQYPVDTILSDVPFYPAEVDLTGIVYDGEKYIASANLPSYSAIIGSVDNQNWAVGKLTNSNVSITDIVYAGGIYLMTSSNPSTPVYRSNDGLVWTTTGYYTPSEASTAVSIASVSLNSASYCSLGQAWIAVGQNILRSTDSYMWEEVTAFNPAFEYQLNAVSPISGTNCMGLIAVGKGKQPDYSTGVTQLVDINLFFYSPNSINWTQAPAITDKGFYGVASDGTTVIAVGENGVIYYTHNLIDEGNWDYQLEKRTSDSQKRLLLKLVEDNNLSLSVERTDWRQKWQFILSPEIAPNTNERIEIDVEIDISVLTPTSFSITATSDDEDVNYDEMLFLLTLSS